METIRVGHGRVITGIPRGEWEQGLAALPGVFKAKLEFMSAEHHLVRNFVVRELPFAKKPLAPEYIADRLNIPLIRVNGILDELEKNITFLFRNEDRAVLWAYPVTADPTPQHLTFSTGEEIYAA